MKFINRDLFLAVSKYVPNGKGKLVKNPFTNWRQINPSLLDIDIKVFGPKPGTGTRDAFAELVLGKGLNVLNF